MMNLSIIDVESLEELGLGSAKDIHLTYQFYEDANRIPLEIVLEADSAFQEGITIDNHDEEMGGFIAFKFDASTKSLGNITFVSIHEGTVFHEELTKAIYNIDGKYKFYLNNADAVRTNYETRFLVDNHRQSILICFGDADGTGLTFYDADEHLSLGVDARNDLKSILLKNLKEQEIRQMLNID